MDASTPQVQDLPQAKVQSLFNLYTEGKMQKVITEALEILLDFPSSAFAYMIIGAANHSLGNLELAVEAYKKSLSIKPDYADAYNNMGISLKDQGNLEKAVEAYKKSLSIRPNYAEAYNNLGICFKEQGKPEEAIDAYERALSINPDYAEPHNNLGTVLKNKGKHEEALEAYCKAVLIKPSYFEAHSNMGVALFEQRKFDEAIEAYSKAISIKPDYAEAYNNLAVTLQNQGKPEEAIPIFIKAKELRPDNLETLYNIANVLSNIKLLEPNPVLQQIIIEILEHKTFHRPKDICTPAISLLKYDSAIKELLKKLNNGTLNVLNRENMLAITEVKLFLTLMSICPINDLDLEALLSNLRSQILLCISKTNKNINLLRFQSALALQCFTNEYIYEESDEDITALANLEASIEKEVREGKQPSSQSVVCLASFKSLSEYKWYDFLKVNSEIQEVFIRQVVEPKEESSLKENIKVLGSLTDKVSSEVREQYEENPYPRWINIGLSLKSSSVQTVTEQIELKLFDRSINYVDAPNVLIAGCGTGQHSIGTASRFKNSKVLSGA